MNKKYSVAYLKGLRTLSRDQTSDLKVESPRLRVWLERGTNVRYEERWRRSKDTGRWRWQITEKIEPETAC